MIDLELERRIGSRIIRAGDVVRVAPLPRSRVAAVIDGRLEELKGVRVLGFRGDEVHVLGAKCRGRVELIRVFKIDDIGARRRVPASPDRT